MVAHCTLYPAVQLCGDTRACAAMAAAAVLRFDRATARPCVRRDHKLGGKLGRRAHASNGHACRMLICATQAGSMIGKSGVTIKEMQDQSGCQNIKVLQPVDLPPCGLSSDKLLHITGNPDSLRKCLELVSSRLRDSPPKELPSHEPCANAFPGGPMGPPGGPMGPRGPPGPAPGYGGPPPGAYGGAPAPYY